MPIWMLHRGKQRILGSVILKRKKCMVTSSMFTFVSNLRAFADCQWRTTQYEQKALISLRQEAKIWNSEFPKRWKWRGENCWKVKPKICMKFYLEKFGWKSCSWEGHVLKNRETQKYQKEAAGMLKREMSRSFQQIDSSGKTEGEVQETGKDLRLSVKICEGSLYQRHSETYLVSLKHWFYQKYFT